MKWKDEDLPERFHELLIVCQFIELSSVYDYLFACTSHVVTVSANFFSQQEAYTRESPFCYLSWRKYYSSASTIERVKGPFNVH